VWAQQSGPSQLSVPLLGLASAQRKEAMLGLLSAQT
jgi:hypothetical protein